MNPKQGRILQNIKTDHFRQLLNQQSSSGTHPKASDQKRKIIFKKNFFEKFAKISFFPGAAF